MADVSDGVDSSKGKGNDYLIDPSQFWTAPEPEEKPAENTAQTKVLVAEGPKPVGTYLEERQLRAAPAQSFDAAASTSDRALIANGGPYYGGGQYFGGAPRYGQPRTNFGGNGFTEQARETQMAGGDRRRRFFQQAGQDGPQRQQGDKPALFKKGLFGRSDAAQPQATLSKIEFNGKDEKGVIKELGLPSTFKETPKDPEVPDDPRREYTIPGTRTKVTYMEGRELMDDEMAMLKNVLSQKNGPLKENSQAWEEACALMGGGYHSFSNNPTVSMEKVAGRNVIVLADQDPRQKLTAYSMFIPSDKGKFLYQLTFDGNSADWPGVKKGIDSIQWRPTPDTVESPNMVKPGQPVKKP